MRYLILALAFCGLTSTVQAQDLSEKQIKELALEAILENPEIIMQAVELLQARERDAAAAQAGVVRSQLELDPTSPNIGNPDGDVTIVEFFDYNCPYCRRAGEALREVLGDDTNVRVIMREWPVLGEGSVLAARAALAARNQDKYEEFHWALMNGQGRANEAIIMKTARDLGMDTDKLKADMNTPAVELHLAQSSEMARTLGFTGTPAFIVGDTAVPGFITAEELKGLIAEARDG